MADIQPHQQRVIDEKAELDGRLEKLTAFLKTETYLGLDIMDRVLLTQQHTIMGELSFVLGERITRFNLEKTNG